MSHPNAKLTQAGRLLLVGQAASLRERYGFEVNAALTGETEIPLPAKETL
ncbi:MAG: hypothetical protein ACSLFM_00700 [Tepidiformaceae bacterium]